MIVQCMVMKGPNANKFRCKHFLGPPLSDLKNFDMKIMVQPHRKSYTLIFFRKIFFIFFKAPPLGGSKLLSSGVTGGGGGAGCPPDIFHWEFFADLLGKRGARKRWKMEKKRRKIWKGRGGKLKMEGKKSTNEQRTFFFFFFFFFFVTFWVYQNGQFLPGKSIFHIGKSDFAPSK